MAQENLISMTEKELFRTEVGRSNLATLKV